MGRGDARGAGTRRLAAGLGRHGARAGARLEPGAGAADRTLPAGDPRAPARTRPRRAVRAAAAVVSAAAAPRRHVAVVLHDVAPSRWAGCTRVIAQCQQVARHAGVTLPLTLLVVPEMHGEPASPEFLRWLRRQVQLGHELALHGYSHHDDGPRPKNLAEHLLRRWYTDNEGEFAALAHEPAAERLRAGLAWAEHHGLPIAGFVAPAWLMSPGAWSAVRAAPFDYTCTLAGVHALPGGEALHARSFVFSTRAAWRRQASLLWNRTLGLAQYRAPLQRFELHPSDCDQASVSRCWSTLLERALRQREPLKMAEAAALARRTGTPPARAAA
ncbi:DUF2334 domain-containing protein [Rubrivivax gelatinosus]|nr:DUF2334 domain-containing protein [Rubrivivax gelatinosus]